MSNYGDWNQGVIDEFRENNGTVSHGFGRALVLVHNVGAKSGIERVSPLMGIRDDADTWFITASKGGAPENPAWYHNLLANPETTIETPDDGVVTVRAVELKGAERDAAWERFKEHSDGFRQYEQRTTRVIPVMALHRI